MAKSARGKREAIAKKALRKRLGDIARGAEPHFVDDDDAGDLAGQMGLGAFGQFLNALRIEFDLEDHAAAAADSDFRRMSRCVAPWNLGEYEDPDKATDYLYESGIQV